MRSSRIAHIAMSLLLSAVAAPGHAQVHSWEGTSLPETQGWDRSAFCTPERWMEGIWFRQALDVGECAPPPDGDRDSYRRSLEAFNGTVPFFGEFRVLTDGDRSEIPGVAPTSVVMGNFAGVSYHITVASDLIKFSGHLYLPGLFFEVEPGVAHTYRIELYPVRYVFFIDGYVMDESVPDGPFPAYDSVMAWRGRSWYLPCHNAWDYIRYGVIPLDASGDYDSDGVVTLDDFYYFHECLTNERPGINGGPGQDAGPGCRFADFDSDSDVDLKDVAYLQVNFTGGG